MASPRVVEEEEEADEESRSGRESRGTAGGGAGKGEKEVVKEEEEAEKFRKTPSKKRRRREGGGSEREKEQGEVAAKGLEGPSGCGGERENGHRREEAESALKLVVKADRALPRARRPCSPPSRVYIPFILGKRETSLSSTSYISERASAARARRYESSTHLSSRAVYTG